MELKVGGYVLNDAGVMLSGYDGKREAYDLAPLVGVRFEERARAIGDIINYKWQFSIAMLNCERVYIYIYPLYIYIYICIHYS